MLQYFQTEYETLGTYGYVFITLYSLRCVTKLMNALRNVTDRFAKVFLNLALRFNYCSIY